MQHRVAFLRTGAGRCFASRYSSDRSTREVDWLSLTAEHLFPSGAGLPIVTDGENRGDMRGHSLRQTHDVGMRSHRAPRRFRAPGRRPGSWPALPHPLRRRASAPTGTSGIGLASARQCEAQGATVVVLARRPESSTSLRHGSVATPRPVTLATLNFLNPRLMSSEKTQGRIDIPVASAGLAPAPVLGETGSATSDETSNVNAKGAFFSGLLPMPPLGDGAPSPQGVKPMTTSSLDMSSETGPALPPIVRGS